MISKRQNALYWREWSAAKRVLFSSQPLNPSPSQLDEARHELHRKALGLDKSHRDFTNGDFDKVLGSLRSISQPDNLSAQLRQLNQDRNRLSFGIRQLAKQIDVGEAYVNGIVMRMNAEGDLGSSYLEELGPTELRKVLVALRQHERRTAHP
jgi:hypothetical protein